MSLAAGTRLGAFEIVDLLGAGGMGEVYRAHDGKLRRDVALKILPPLFAADPHRRARFTREAHVLASLNHPNIASIYGIEESGDVTALVMELVDGETLADRIARGPIPVADTIQIATHIADALDAAHEKGVVHRDLKPANIKIAGDGRVKVLDFGLAKALADDESADASMSPTMTAVASRLGVIVGTAAYLSPEQAKGRPVDKRADIWAFGCVLFEMLSGRRAFTGEDIADFVVAIMTKEPEWAHLPAATPDRVVELLRHCLTKDLRSRLRDIGDARFELAVAANAPAAGVPPMPARHRPLAAAIGLGAAGGLAVGALAASWIRPTPAAATRRVVRAELALTGPAALSFGGYGRDFEIARDGSRLVYVGDRERRVFSRALDALESVPISSQSNPQQPTISPDGQSFGYLAPAFTWRRQTFNGVQRPSVTLQVGGFRGVAWEADGSVIAATHGGDLLRLDEGGKTSTLAKANPAGGEVGLFWPCLTPTRGKILVTVVTNAPSDPYSIASLDVSAGTRTTLLRGTYPQLVKTGHLLFANDGAIWAVQFDAQRAQVVGSPVRVLESVATTPYGAAEMTVSDEGTVVYARGGSIGARTLAWVDRDGREEPLQMPPRPYIYPRISPDGGSVAVTVRDAARDIWIWDLKTTTLRRLTNTPDLEDFPLWSPDGATVMYSGTFKGVFAKSAAGSGDARRIAPPFPAMSISPDGSRMVGGGIGFGTSLIIIGGDTPTMRDILKDENPMNPRISPDGKWLAYQSRQSGQYEIYVRPFPDVDRERRQVSVQGGTRPVWARNMREIFYLSPAGAMMSVAVAPDAQFTSKEPVKLFQIRHRIGGASEPFTMYDVAPDGRRFLVIKDGELESLAEPRLTVIQNWFEELQRLVPAVRR